MSKIRNLFKKFTRKNKKAEDSEKEFFDDVESEDLEEYETEESHDQTVIINSDEIGEELIPHVSETESQIPPNSDLNFPKIPTKTEEVLVQNESEEDDDFGDLFISEEEEELTEVESDEDDFADLTLSEEDDSDAGESEENDSEEDSDDFSDLVMPSEDGTVQTSEIDLSSENQEEEEEVEQLSSEDFEAEEYEDEEPEAEELEATPHEDDEFALESSFTQTNTIDLGESKITFKDKVDHFKTRAIDRFRNLNKKDLKKAFKNPEIPVNNKVDFNKLKSRAQNVNWANIPTQFFNKANRNKAHRFFQISLVVISVFTCAKLIGILVSGTKDYKSLTKRSGLIFDDSNKFSKSELDEIKAANVFRTEQVQQVVEKTKKTPVSKKLCESSTKKSRVDVKLVNTIVLQDSVKSIASVQMRSSNKLQSIRVGETLLGKVKVDKIERLKLIVRNVNSGACEFIENENFKKKNSRRKAVSVMSPKKSKEFKKQLKKIEGIENDGNDFKIDRKFLKGKLGDINSILTQARGIQITNPDGTISFKIVDIEPGGIFAYLGMEDNDIITQINGEPIKELNEVMNLFGKVGNLSKLNLTIKRNGEENTQNYSIK